MHFSCIFLILVSTLTLAQSEQISDLPHYVEASYTFKEIDTNHNDILELSELIASFDYFKEKQSDVGIKREWFVGLLVKDGSSQDVSEKLFDLYDTDDNGVLNDSDYEIIYHNFDTDGDGRVNPEEFIRGFNDILIKAYADVRQLKRR